MKYQVGDTVLILHSNEEAKIIEIMNTEMLLVEVEGISFPVYMDQVDFPYFKRFTEKKIVPAKKEKIYIDDVRKEKPVTTTPLDDGVWLSFLPVMVADVYGEEQVVLLKIHLLNRTHTSYRFVYRLHFFGRPDFELVNEIKPFENFYIHDIAFSDLNDSPTFEFDFSLMTPDPSKADILNKSRRIKPKQLFEQIRKLKENNEAMFSEKLFDHFPQKVIEIKPELGEKAKKGRKLYDASKARQHIEPARSVIDLHIEKLTDDWKHLSNFEILSTQLKAFEKYYDLAITHFQPSLTVIHGVGEGKLKNEIHELLKGRKEVKSFVNQYSPLYGFGATEILFSY